MVVRSLLFSVVLLWSFPALAAVSWYEDHEGPLDTDDTNIEACCSWSQNEVTDHARRGLQGMRFELRDDDDDEAGSKRSEITQWPIRATTTGGLGDTRWFGMSFYLPADWETDVTQELIMQWQSVRDGCDSSGRSPMQGLYFDDDGTWFWSIRSQSAKCGTSNPPATKIDFGDIQIGEWVDLVMHIKWEHDSSGFTKVWKNGILIVDYTGPNMYNDDPGSIYLKYGVYKWPWKNNPGASNISLRVLYWDEIRIGDENSSFVEVQPFPRLPAGSGLMMGMGR